MAKVGCPLKFKNKEELETKINEYFSMCDNRTKKVKVKDGIMEMPDPRPYTVTGLALHLNTNRQTLINYESRDEFFDTITRAKNKIENFVEESLWTPKIATGIIFNLKNNYEWRDKIETDITTKGDKLENTNMDLDKLANDLANKLKEQKLDGKSTD